MILARGSALIHLVKYSTVMRRNLTYPLAMGNGSRMSIPHMAKGQGDVMLWSASSGVWRTLLNSWHSLQVLTYLASVLKVGQ